MSTETINNTFNPELHREEITMMLNALAKTDAPSYKQYRKITSKHLKPDGSFYGKDEILAVYEMLVKEGSMDDTSEMRAILRMKPTRTISGVATVTVLTKPFPCPGKCIFCPNDVKMPKSYLSDEPGAQRAERNNFDPYLQAYNRLLALKNIGHNTDKVELIILGGTWSFYPVEYQIWFVKECFRAMNDFGVKDGRAGIVSHNQFEEADNIPRETPSGRKRSYNEIISHVESESGEDLISDSERSTWDELFEQQVLNENALSRCVGLVIETRPDYIDEEEVVKIRKLGATKVQIGIQSLNDEVMALNMRGHGERETREAIRLLRLGGFKIHAHWMPNLYGSTVEKDIADYVKLWEEGIQPDELKIYPTSIIENTDLYELYKRGKYKPYKYDELLEVLSSVMPTTPRYCRLTRIIRDIPSTDIVAGNKLTNFRQIAEKDIVDNGGVLQDIRSREIKGETVAEDDLELEVIKYRSAVGDEYFISYRTHPNAAKEEECECVGKCDGDCADCENGCTGCECNGKCENGCTDCKCDDNNKAGCKCENGCAGCEVGCKCGGDCKEHGKPEGCCHGSHHCSSDCMREDHDCPCEHDHKILEENKKEKSDKRPDKADNSDRICGFLRLTIPDKEISATNFIPELQNKAIIREVHVYGQVVGIGKKREGRSQHLGLGRRMIELAEQMASDSGYSKIAVISAIGTKEYYKKRGFEEDGLYMSKAIK